jgi:predicted dehydrogenase
VQTLRIAMNGVTGRMGLRQHLLRSILPIRADGGVLLDDGSRLQVEPMLVGRSAEKLAALAAEHGVDSWTTDADAALDVCDVYFDAQVTSRRVASITAALKAGRHVYTEKPTAETLADAVELARLGASAGVTVGVVHDKLYLPGLLKLRRLVDDGFFGRVLSLRGEFGYWVFEGADEPGQRPSWNYRAEDGGGITLDMFAHWSYVLEGILGRVASVTARAVTHIPERWDESGQRYDATADDAAYAIFELDGGVIAQVNSSWAVRVHRDELVEFQVDGTLGSAVAGLHHCVAQARAATPRPVWDPDVPTSLDFRAGWTDLSVVEEGDEGARLETSAPMNGFRAQWEEFLRDVAAGRPHRHDLVSAARGVQLAELALASSAQRRTLGVPEILL